MDTILEKLNRLQTIKDALKTLVRTETGADASTQFSQYAELLGSKIAELKAGGGDGDQSEIIAELTAEKNALEDELARISEIVD